MKIKLLIFITLILSANIASAYTITGTVTSDGTPLPGVVITRIGVGNGGDDVEYAVTDINGHYTVDSGTKSNITLIASYASYMSELKTVTSPVVNFDLKKTPNVPVQLFQTIVENSAPLDYVLSAQLHSMGKPGWDAHIYLSGNHLVFSLMTDEKSISGYDINTFANTTIRGYLEQLKAEGGLDAFLNQMQSSGMKWYFGVYSKSAEKWLQSKEYDASQTRKLL